MSLCWAGSPDCPRGICGLVLGVPASQTRLSHRFSLQSRAPLRSPEFSKYFFWDCVLTWHKLRNRGETYTSTNQHRKISPRWRWRKVKIKTSVCGQRLHVNSKPQSAWHDDINEIFGCRWKESRPQRNLVKGNENLHPRWFRGVL